MCERYMQLKPVINEIFNETIYSIHLLDHQDTETLINLISFLKTFKLITQVRIHIFH